MNKALIGFEWCKNERIRIRGRGRQKIKLQVVRGKKGNGRPDAGGMGAVLQSLDSSFRSPAFRFPRFHSTFEIIEAIEQGEFQARAMMTFHPQRWSDDPAAWVKELVWQGVKNGVKKGIVKSQKIKDERQKRSWEKGEGERELKPQAGVGRQEGDQRRREQ